MAMCAAESPALLEQFVGQIMSKEDRVVCTVTGEDGRAEKSYCTFRAAKAVLEAGLVLTPTNSRCTSYTDLPPKWGVRTADYRLGFKLATTRT